MAKSVTRIRNLSGVVSRSDLYMVDPRVINVMPNFNPREDFEGHDELVNFILKNGFKFPPLKVKRGGLNDSEIFLLDGERRLRAVMEVINRGVDIKAIPCIFERLGISDGEALTLALNSNEGKRHTPMEEAKAYARLKSYGYSVTKIADDTGKTTMHVYNRLTLIDASPAVQQAVQEGELGTTAAVEIIKKSKGDIAHQNQALSNHQAKPRIRMTKFDRMKEQAPKLTTDQIKSLIALLTDLLTAAEQAPTETDPEDQE